MIHDQDLVDRLSELPADRFEGEVFRATGISIDPTAASITGGRWAPPPDRDAGVAVLYTSFESNGALGEVCSFLADLTPIPGPRPLKITRLAISTGRTVRLSHSSLIKLGVDMDRYGARDYDVTQKIGAALAFLGVDCLIAPSARWPCDNLMVFADNHALVERLEAIEVEQVEWIAWSRANGIIT
jgi:hypothetical protein